MSSFPLISHRMFVAAIGQNARPKVPSDRQENPRRPREHRKQIPLLERLRPEAKPSGLPGDLVTNDA